MLYSSKFMDKIIKTKFFFTISGKRDKRKRDKPLISHRFNRLPLLPSGPGGVQQELVV